MIAALLRNIDGCWRAANYVSVGQIYLYDNPSLKTLKLAHIKTQRMVWEYVVKVFSTKAANRHSACNKTLMGSPVGVFCSSERNYSR